MSFYKGERKFLFLINRRKNNRHFYLFIIVQRCTISILSNPSSILWFWIHVYMFFCLIIATSSRKLVIHSVKMMLLNIPKTIYILLNKFGYRRLIQFNPVQNTLHSGFSRKAIAKTNWSQCAKYILIYWVYTRIQWILLRAITRPTGRTATTFGGFAV